MSIGPLEKHYAAQRLLEQRDMQDVPSVYRDPGSVDAWRHRRMLSALESLVDTFGGCDWLTVGDGRYGSEANWLKSRGARAVSSSISAETLSAAKEQGYIDDFLALNAEFLDLADGSFDFVLCKESYHHFPRPPVALFEMLRVARIAVVLIEPMEEGWRVLEGLKRLAKRLLNRPEVEFEPSGNYLYRTNPIELKKLLAASGQGTLAIRRMNDFYHRTFMTSRADVSFGSVMTRMGITVQDVLCRARLMNWGLGVFVIFKMEPDETLCDRMSKAGFSFVKVPKNPYL